MNRVPFRTDFMDGDEGVMVVDRPSQIRFNHKTREISVEYGLSSVLKYDDMHWRKIKELVLAEGGKWINKKEGIEFLLKSAV